MDKPESRFLTYGPLIPVNEIPDMIKRFFAEKKHKHVAYVPIVGPHELRTVTILGQAALVVFILLAILVIILLLVVCVRRTIWCCRRCVVSSKKQSSDSSARPSAVSAVPSSHDSFSYGSLLVPPRRPMAPVPPTDTPTSQISGGNSRVPSSSSGGEGQSSALYEEVASDPTTSSQSAPLSTSSSDWAPDVPVAIINRRGVQQHRTVI